MERSHFHKSPVKNHHGVTVIFVAVVLLVMIGMASLAVDIGFIAVTKNELQNAADAAALAATRKLGDFYEDMTIDEQIAYTIDPNSNLTDYNSIYSIAQNVGELNTPAGNSLSVFPPEITEWEGPNTEATIKISTQTSIDFFFAKVLGFDSMEIGADATAALTTVGYIESDLLPVGISSSWFQNFPNYCGQEITLYPVTNSCVAWHIFDSTEVSVDAIKSVLLEMYNSSFQTNLSSGDDIRFTDNTGAEKDDDLYDRFRMVYENQNDPRGYYINEMTPKYVKDESGDYLLDENGQKIRDLWFNPLTGTGGIEAYEREFVTNVIVFDHGVDPSDCNNPGGIYKVAGYAKIKIKTVYRIPEKRIVATVECVFAPQSERKPGGNYYGFNGSIPAIVE